LYITFHLLFKPAHFIFSLNSWRLDIYIPDHRLIYFEGIFIWSSYIRVSKCWPAGMQVCTYNSTLRDPRQVDLEFKASSGLCNEFKANLGCIARACLKINK
jgi:hypothetical protein